LGGGVEQSRSTGLVIDRTKVGDAARLAALLKLMVERRLLSAFVGRPLEGEALNRIARSIFTPEASGATGIELLRTDSELIASLVSEHFNQVLEDSRRKVSFFKGVWKTMRQDDRFLAIQGVPLLAPLRIGTEQREVHGLLLEFDLPRGSDGLVARDDTELDCWMLGKVIRLSFSNREARPWLCLHFRVLAGLAEAAEV
jgi:hypothetical protein